MTLADALARAESERKRLTVYAPEDPGLDRQFDTRNATVEYEPLPETGTGGFVVVRDAADEFVAAVGLAQLHSLLEPPLFRPWDEDVLEEGYRAVFELLDDTLFASFDRRQLLATAREIENRAWRVGEGTLHVGFQSFSAMRPQVPVYERLAADTRLEIHVYGDDDWEPPSIPGVTYHAESGGEIGAFWFLVFDAGDGETASALVAEERAPDEFYGFWTYDPATVRGLRTHLEVAYGGS